MFRDFEEEAMGGEKQIFVDVAMVIKTMLLNPGRFLKSGHKSQILFGFRAARRLLYVWCSESELRIVLEIWDENMMNL